MNDSRFNTSNITITGHSLGGAIAQILSQTTLLPVVAFDAPGAGSLLTDPGIQSALSPLAGMIFPNIGPNKNIRLYGDQVSLLAGVSVPSSIIYTVETSNSLLPVCGYWAAALVNHSIDNLILQLSAGAAQTPGITNPVAEVLFTAVGQTLTSARKISTLFFEAVVTGGHVAHGWDPVAANEYAFLGQPGSPYFESLILPWIPGISSYRVGIFTNNTWGPNLVVSPLQILNLPAGTSGFKNSWLLMQRVGL